MPVDFSLSTAYEKYWHDLPAGKRLELQPTFNYDLASSVLYFQNKYIHSPIHYVPDQIPDNDWVVFNFESFVRGEFGKASSLRGDYPGDLEFNQRNINLIDVALKYLEVCENELVYSGIVNLHSEFQSRDMPSSILSVLCDPNIGNKANAKFLERNFIKGNLEDRIKHKRRLEFVFPAFPFKDQNIFRTDSPASHVGLGELALLIRLHVLSLALYQVHPHGADWIILSDGAAYGDMLNIEPSEVTNYKNDLIRLRNDLNIQNTVRILDLQDLANKVMSRNRGDEIFSYMTDKIRGMLSAMTKLDSQTNFIDSLVILTRGMKWNANFKHYFNAKGIEPRDAWKILNTNSLDYVDLELREYWKEIDTIATEVALNYAAYNLTLRYLKFYDIMFPFAIRATVHAKSNQVAVPVFGSISPWNGVCIVKDDVIELKSIEVIELYKLLKKKNVIANTNSGSNIANFYTTYD